MNILIRNTVLTFLLFAISTMTAFADYEKGLFGSSEFKSTKLEAFKKWNDLHNRHENEIKHSLNKPDPYMAEMCKFDQGFKCLQNEWLNILENLKKENNDVKLDTINRYLNRASYITDIVNWQKTDYWATIQQFFDKEGDCEDYAIAKYYSLKSLGFDKDQMRIVVVQDINLNIAHAVLAVYLGEKIWILDNQISRVITDDKINHYVPLYSINETAWWLHKQG